MGKNKAEVFIYVDFNVTGKSLFDSGKTLDHHLAQDYWDIARAPKKEYA